MEPHSTRMTKILARKRRIFPRRTMIPNVMTLMALCLGLIAIRFTFSERFEFAIACIIVAALIDTIDGRLARLLNAESPLGAQLDSLSDFVNFGIAPALMLYAWGLIESGRVGWMAVIVFCVCCALRLARFNITTPDEDQPAWQRKFFTGVPSPAAAGLVMLPILFANAQIIDLRTISPLFVGLVMVIVGLLMVSRLPTFSGRSLAGNVRRDFVLPLMLGVGFIAVLLSAFPWHALVGLGVTYIASLPVSWWQMRRYLHTGQRDTR